MILGHALDIPRNIAIIPAESGSRIRIFGVRDDLDTNSISYLLSTCRDRAVTKECDETVEKTI
jgi:hypothetical protein